MRLRTSGIRDLPAIAIALGLCACAANSFDDAPPDGPPPDLGAAPDLPLIDMAATDLASTDLAGSNPDLAGLHCQGNETFQAARAAMLATCGGFPSCHMASPFAGTLDLTAAHAYQDLVDVAASIAPTKRRVKPGDPDGSFLVQKLTDTQGADEGAPMPRGEAIRWQPPDPAKLAILKCWIAAGAQNN
jgi:hypothetical protein